MTAVSAPAGTRIRRFSLGIGILGAAVALVTVLAVVVPRIDRELRNDTAYPWLAGEVVHAERDGSVWGSAGSALVTLPDGLRGRPVALRAVSLGDENSVAVFLGDRSWSDRAPRYLGGLWRDESMPIAAYDGSELWVTADAPWRIEILPVELQAFVSPESGRDDAVFVYRGEASTGTVAWSGEGSLYVVARTADGYETLVTPSDAPKGTRFAWQPSPFVVIQVLAFGDFSWSIELDEAPAPVPSSPAPEGADG